MSELYTYTDEIYSRGSDLRHLAQSKEVKSVYCGSDGDLAKIKDDIQLSPAAPLMGLEKFGATGLLGLVTSYADETAAAVGATAATTVANYYFPEYVNAENSTILFNSMLGLQAYWLASGMPAMVETWRDLKSTGICTSPTAKATYESMSQVTNNEVLKKIAFGTGYWYWNIVKELPWWTAGGLTAAGSAMSLDVDPISSMSIFLGGACIGSSLYQFTQWGIQRTLRRRRERSTKVV